MKHVVSVGSGREPDTDERSLRARILPREKEVLRDTYYLIDREDRGKGPAKRLTCGFTIIYPTGSTTGHAHDDMEEIYYFIKGEGIMVVGDDEFEVKGGDACYVPPGQYHTTYQKGILPLEIVWNTCKVEPSDIN